MVVWIGALIDVICCDEHRVRHLPKPLWLLTVLLVPLIGSVLWLLIGRPLPDEGLRRPARSPFPEYDRPGRLAAQTPDSDEEFLRRCRERAEQQRRTARDQQRRRDDSADESA